MNTLGPACDVIYGKSLEEEFRRAFAHTNISVPFGTCPIPAQWIGVKDYLLKDLGDYLPPYVPGNERWKITVRFLKEENVESIICFYLILRDEQKLFDSKW